MPRKLPTTDAESHDYVQFRGPQTSVVHDPTGIRFGTEARDGRMAHEVHPVVDDDADPADVPDDAIAQAVAAELVESNPLVCYGIACETCGDVFDSPRAMNSHQSAHADATPDDGVGDDDDADDWDVPGDDGSESDGDDADASLDSDEDDGADSDPDGSGGGDSDDSGDSGGD